MSSRCEYTHMTISMSSRCETICSASNSTIPTRIKSLPKSSSFTSGRSYAPSTCVEGHATPYVKQHQPVTPIHHVRSGTLYVEQELLLNPRESDQLHRGPPMRPFLRPFGDQTPSTHMIKFGGMALIRL